jgi:hypothetical protein
MSTSGVVVHYVGRGCLSHNPRKYTVLVGCFVFDLCDFNLCDIVPGVKRDLPVYYSKICDIY